MAAGQAAGRTAHAAPVQGRDLVEEGGTGRDVRNETTVGLTYAHG
jgi:hypothetical protein